MSADLVSRAFVAIKTLARALDGATDDDIRRMVEVKSMRVVSFKTDDGATYIASAMITKEGLPLVHQVTPKAPPADDDTDILVLISGRWHIARQFDYGRLGKAWGDPETTAWLCAIGEEDGLASLPPMSARSDARLEFDPAYTDGPFYVVPMPTNARGQGPETDPLMVVKTDYEVWNGHTLSIGSWPNEQMAKFICDALNRGGASEPVAHLRDVGTPDEPCYVPAAKGDPGAFPVYRGGNP